MVSIPIIWHPDYLLHKTGYGHPERPERCVAICNALQEEGLLNLVAPRLALRKELELCHKSSYIDLVKVETAEGRSQLSTGDVTICPDSWHAALLAAGGVITGIEIVMNGESNAAFCLVRPPGHHANASVGMGFCLFNNVAIATRYAQQQYEVKRILIVDWDVHHGNGTQDIFENDPSVFYFSTHQSPLYPFTGLQSHDNILNCPIAADKDSRNKVLEAFQDQLVPAMQTFKPQLVLISAGFDAHQGDPLGALGLTDTDFIHLTNIVKEIACEHAGGRIVSVLEGGYSLQALASAVPKHVRALNHT
ncbi:MAG: histone deacetylase [Chlamydiales bacterium]|nr:histone deacetylase [Chlamydiales bacterium]